MNISGGWFGKLWTFYMIFLEKFTIALFPSNNIPHEIVHSFPNHPLRKFIAYLPYFIYYLPYIIAYLTWLIAYLSWVISYQVILKLSENAVKIIHSLLTIDHSFPNHHPKMFIAYLSYPPNVHILLNFLLYILLTIQFS